MSIANAWLLDLGDDLNAAIGQRELFHLVYEPVFFPVPQSPGHCARVILWEGRVLPVWDMHCWLQRGTRTTQDHLLAVVGYSSGHSGETGFGAFSIAVPPQRIVVRDEDACALPAGSARWARIAASCFTHHDRPIPALDLTAMFGQSLAQAA